MRKSLALLPMRKQTASMPNVLIRDLPTDVHAVLQARAAASGQSLQQYLTSELSRVARTPTMAEVLDRIDARAATSDGRIGFAEAVEAIDTGRAERDRR